MAADPVSVDVERHPMAELTREVGRRYGLSLRECTPEGVAQRLRFRVRDRALDGVDAYAEYLLYSVDGAAWEELVETLTANESRIFGAPGDFTPLFEIETEPRWSRYARAAPPAGRFRCLSAACGTGEEAYSLAIALAEARSRAPALEFEVLGVDLSARAIAKARRAMYPASRALSLPDELKERYLVERDGGISAEPLRPFVHFARINLCEPGALSPLGEFELILARDLLPALTAEGRGIALSNLAHALRPGGVLLLGAEDSPGGLDLGIFPTRWGERLAYEKPGGPVSSSAYDEDLAPEPMTTLIAHRSQLVRSWLRILLEQRGYRVEEAPDGVRALERSVMGRPRALYLLELTLPVHGGPAVAERLERMGAATAGSVTYLSPRDPAAADAAALPAGARVLALPLLGRELEAALPIATL